jgi:hypothetical protein
MKLHEFVQRVRTIFHRDARLTDDLIRELIRSLESTQDDECSCDDVYALLDQYAEIQIRGEDAARLMPLLKEHIESCDECHDEYEALLRVLENPDPSTKSQAA